jgi:hypothetical protein
MSICPFFHNVSTSQLRGAINLQSFPLRKDVAMPHRKDHITENNQEAHPKTHLSRHRATENVAPFLWDLR